MANLIYKKMSEVMKDIGSVSKDQKNDAQGFKFRGIDNMINALYPALTKHGVFLTPELVGEEHVLKDLTDKYGKSVVEKHVHIKMKFHFYAEDGSSVAVGPIPAEGLDRGDKATNKALSAALKYALIQTFSVPTEDMVDADSDSPTIEKPPSSSLYGTTMIVNIPNPPPPVLSTTNPDTPDLSVKAPESESKGGFRKPKANNGVLWK